MRSGPLLLFLVQESFVVEGVYFPLHFTGQHVMPGFISHNLMLTMFIWWKWSFLYFYQSVFLIGLFDIYIISKYCVSKTKFKRPLYIFFRTLPIASIACSFFNLSLYEIWFNVLIKIISHCIPITLIFYTSKWCTFYVNSKDLWKIRKGKACGVFLFFCEKVYQQAVKKEREENKEGMRAVLWNPPEVR